MRSAAGIGGLISVSSCRTRIPKEKKSLRYLLIRTAGLCCALLLLSGCGGEDYGTPVTVTGTIKVDSKPLADANVTFNAAEGLPADLRTRMAKTDAEGKYKLEDVYPAEYQVMVQKIAYNIEEAPADAGVAAKDPLAAYGPESKLKAKVSPDETNFDFNL